MQLFKKLLQIIHLFGILLKMVIPPDNLKISIPNTPLKRVFRLPLQMQRFFSIYVDFYNFKMLEFYYAEIHERG